MPGFVPSRVSKDLHQTRLYGTIALMGAAHAWSSFWALTYPDREHTRSSAHSHGAAQYRGKHIFCMVVSFLVGLSRQLCYNENVP
jgi:hypothetical protein